MSLSRFIAPNWRRGDRVSTQFALARVTPPRSSPLFHPHTTHPGFPAGHLTATSVFGARCRGFSSSSQPSTATKTEASSPPSSSSSPEPKEAATSDEASPATTDSPTRSALGLATGSGGEKEEEQTERKPKLGLRFFFRNLFTTARRLRPFFHPAKREIGIGLVCLPFGLVSTIALPYVAGRFVDQLSNVVAHSGSMADLTPTMGLVAGIAVVGTIGSGFRSYYFNLAGEKVSKHMRVTLFSQMLKKKTPFFDRHRTGDLMNRLAADTSIVSGAMTESISMAVRGLATLILGTAVLIYTSPMLAMTTVGVIVPFLVIFRFYGRFIKLYTNKQLRKYGDAASVAEEALGNIRTVGTFAREPFEAQRYSTEIQDAYIQGRKIAIRRGIFMGSVNMVIAASVMGILGMGAYDSLQPHPSITSGQYATFLMLSGHVGGALMSLSSVYNSLMRAMGAGERILEIMENQDHYPEHYTNWRIEETRALVELDPRRPLSAYGHLPSEAVDQAAVEYFEDRERRRVLEWEKQQILQAQLADRLNAVVFPDLAQLEHPAYETAKVLVEETPEGLVYSSREAYLREVLNACMRGEESSFFGERRIFVRTRDGGEKVQVYPVLRRGQQQEQEEEERRDWTPTLHFRDVDFNYPARPEQTVFKGLDLKIPIGSVCAVLGPSGSGKSTLLGLLGRFYEPDAGSVEIAGVPVDEVDLRWLRSQIGSVPQETVLFRGTIADNIRYGDHSVTQEEVERAAKRANAHEFIMQTPLGYETPANQLSGGQKQRIACARAIAMDPPILVLDEATSALDVDSEFAVQQALENLMQGRTTIVIAHRLSTIRNAEYIAILDEGRVVEFGTRDEVMSLEGGRFNEYLAKSAAGTERVRFGFSPRTETPTEQMKDKEKEQEPDRAEEGIALDVEIDPSSLHATDPEPEKDTQQLRV